MNNRIIDLNHPYIGGEKHPKKPEIDWGRTPHVYSFITFLFGLNCLVLDGLDELKGIYKEDNIIEKYDHKSIFKLVYDSFIVIAFNHYNCQYVLFWYYFSYFTGHCQEKYLY